MNMGRREAIVILINWYVLGFPRDIAAMFRSWGSKTNRAVLLQPQMGAVLFWFHQVGMLPATHHKVPTEPSTSPSGPTRRHLQYAIQND